ncbi:hypothetical protein Tco_0689361 [Tanacetum coccineum]
MSKALVPLILTGEKSMRDSGRFRDRVIKSHVPQADSVDPFDPDDLANPVDLADRADPADPYGIGSDNSGPDFDVAKLGQNQCQKLTASSLDSHKTRIEPKELGEFGLTLSFVPEFGLAPKVLMD